MAEPARQTRSESAPLDAEEVSARLREHVARRAHGQNVPAMSLQARSDLALLQQAYDVYHAELGSSRSGLGALVEPVRRLLRRLLAPILGRQVEFNLTLARHAGHVIEQLETLAHEQASVRARLDGAPSNDADAPTVYLSAADPVLEVARDGDALAELRKHADGTFGGVHASVGLDALDAGTTGAVLDEAYRVLRPGGAIVVAARRSSDVVCFALEAAGFETPRVQGLHDGRTVVVATRP